MLKRHVRSVLVVDDDADYLAAIPHLIPDRDVFVLGDDRFLVHELRSMRPDLLLLDFVLGPERDGLQAIKRIKRAAIDVSIALVSAGMHPTIVEVLQRRSGADVVWPKPFSERDMDALLTRVETGKPSPVRSVDNIDSFAEVRRLHARNVVSMCGGNKSEAARRLRVSRPTLIRALKGNMPPSATET